MVVRFRGSHQEAPAPYKTLLQFIREHSFPITGFYREITRLLFPHLQQSPCLLILDFQHGTTIFTLFHTSNSLSTNLRNELNHPQ